MKSALSLLVLFASVSAHASFESFNCTSENGKVKLNVSAPVYNVVVGHASANYTVASSFGTHQGWGLALTRAVGASKALPATLELDYDAVQPHWEIQGLGPVVMFGMCD